MTPEDMSSCWNMRGLALEAHNCILEWNRPHLCTRAWTPSFLGAETHRSAAPWWWGACRQCGRRSASCCCGRPPGEWKAPAGPPGLQIEWHSCHTCPLPWFDKHTLRWAPGALLEHGESHMGWEGQLSSGQAATGGKSWQSASLQQSVKAKEIPVKGGPLAFAVS